MTQDLTAFTKLIGQAGSSAALLSKFPYLCNIQALAYALENSHYVPLGAQRNPNLYDKWDMAYQIIAWFDEYADYPSGKAPATITERYASSGINWSQREFWTSGVYKVEDDTGYPVLSINVNETGNHYFQDVTVNDIPLYQVGNTTYNGSFNASKKFFVGGSVDYLNHISGPTTIDLWKFRIADIKSFYWKNLNQTQQYATDGSGLIGVDDTTPSFVQTSESAYYGYGLQIPGTSNPVGSTDNIAKLISSNKPANTATNPIILADTPDYIGGAQYGTIEPTVATVFNDDCYFEQSFAAGWTTVNRIPFTNLFDINGDPALPPSAASISHVSKDGVSWPTAIVIDPENLGNGCEKYNNEPLDMIFSVNGTYPELYLEFDVRTSARYPTPLPRIPVRFRGLPVYRLWVRYFDMDLYQDVEKEVYVAIHQFVTPEISDAGGWDWHVFGASLLLNNEGFEGAGGNFALYETTAKDTTPAQFQTKTLFNVEVEGNSIGTEFAESGVPIQYFGRKLANPFGGGPRASKLIFPSTDALIDSDPLPFYGVTVSAQRDMSAPRNPREITTILHSNNYHADDDTTYRHAWFGTDNEYEDTEYWAREITRTGGRISGFGAFERPTENLFATAVPGYDYSVNYVEETLQPNGLIYAYEGGPYGTKGSSEYVPQEDFLLDEKYNSLDKGVFYPVITNGKLTGFTTVDRIDGDGLANPGGWGYGNQRIKMTLVRDLNVPLNSNTILPEVYYHTNTAAANGVGNRATPDLNGADFFPGVNVPNGAFILSIAYGGGEQSPLLDTPSYAYLDGNDSDTASSRKMHPGFYPAEISITSERPVLRSTSRSLIENVRGNNAQRYKFEYKYPPMTKDTAKNLIASFEKFRGGQKAFQIRLPRVGVKLLQEYNQYDGYSSHISILANYNEGENEIKIDGVPADKYYALDEGTYFQIEGDQKLYQIVDNAFSNTWGETTIRIEPGLKKSVGTNTKLVTSPQYSDEYLWITVRFEDDELEYTTDGTGLFTLSFKFVEALA